MEDNVEEVAHALEGCTEGIDTVTSEDIADVANTLEHIVAVEIPSEEVYLFATHFTYLCTTLFTYLFATFFLLITLCLFEVCCTRPESTFL